MLNLEEFLLIFYKNNIEEKYDMISS